jgi:hypothetical protein
MDALIVTAASTGLALAMLLVPTVLVTIAMLGAIFLLFGASAAALAYFAGVPVAR